MKQLKSIFSNVTRAIAVVVTFAIMASFLMVVFADYEGEPPPPTPEVVHEPVVIATPAPTVSEPTPVTPKVAVQIEPSQPEFADAIEMGETGLTEPTESETPNLTEGNEDSEPLENEVFDEDNMESEIIYEEPPTVLGGEGSFVTRFIDYDDSLLKANTLRADEEIVFPKGPTREGYFFAGWDRLFERSTDDVVYIQAIYVEAFDLPEEDELLNFQLEEGQYKTALFIDHDGSLIYEMTFMGIMPMNIGPNTWQVRCGSWVSSVGTGHPSSVTCGRCGRTLTGGTIHVFGLDGSAGNERRLIFTCPGPGGGGGTPPPAVNLSVRFYQSQCQGWGFIASRTAPREGWGINWDQTPLSGVIVPAGTEHTHWRRSNGELAINIPPGWLGQGSWVDAGLTPIQHRVTVTNNTGFTFGTMANGWSQGQDVNHGSNATLPNISAGTISQCGRRIWQGWNNNGQNITGPRTITPNAPLVRRHAVTYTVTVGGFTFTRSGGGALAQNIEHTMNASAPTMNPFSTCGRRAWPGWNNNGQNIIAPRTIAPNPLNNSHVRRHAVTFRLENNGITGTHLGGGALNQNVEHTMNAVMPIVERPYGHTFEGWNNDGRNIIAPRTIVAQYAPMQFNVIFVDENGDEIYRQEVDFGTAATPPSDPEKYGYIFDGWDCDDFVIDSESDLIVAPKFVPRQYDVIFLNYDEAEHYRVPTYFGETADAPAESPTKEGYNFSHWDTDDFTIRTEADLIVNALFVMHCTHPGCNVEDGLCDVCDRCEEHCICCIENNCDNPKTCPTCDRCNDCCICCIENNCNNPKTCQNCDRCNSCCICTSGGGGGNNNNNDNNVGGGSGGGGDGGNNNNNVGGGGGGNNNNNNINRGGPPTCLHPGCNEAEDLCDLCRRCDEHCICLTCAYEGCDERKNLCSYCRMCPLHCANCPTGRLGRWIQTPDPPFERFIPEENAPQATLIATETAEIIPQPPRGDPPLFSIMGRDVFLFAPLEVLSWALVNLLLTLVGILLSIIITLSAIKAKRASAKNLENCNEESISEDKSSKKIKWFAIGAIISVLGVVIFALTQDLTALIALLDHWTIVHMALIIAQIVVFKIYKSGQAKGGTPNEDADACDAETEIRDDDDDETVTLAY